LGNQQSPSHQEGLTAHKSDQKRQGREGGWTIGALFWRRLGRFWKDQWAVWRTALDWTVWVYLVIPALWIGGGLYLELWHTQPAWMLKVPLWVGESLPIVIILLGSLRTFAEEADILFLLQKPSWRQGILLRSFIYTIVTRVLVVSLFIGVLLPFLIVVHQVTTAKLIGLFLVVWLWSMIGALGRNLIEGRYRGWRRNVAKTAAMAALAALAVVCAVQASQLYTGIALVAGLAATALLLRRKLRAHEMFESDVEREKEIRITSTRLLLRDVIERRPKVKLNRPVVLRRSTRLFKSFDADVVLAEQAIKVFVRHFHLVRMWFSFFGASLIALVLSPTWVNVILLALLPLLIARWVQSHCYSFAIDPFVAQFGLSSEVLKKADERARFWIIVPGVVLLGLAAGGVKFGIAGLLGGVAAGFYWWSVNKIMTDILQLKARKK